MAQLAKNDKKGKYGIDGVSYDGNEIYVVGDNTNADSNRKKENPKKEDLKRNLDYENEKQSEIKNE